MPNRQAGYQAENLESTEQSKRRIEMKTLRNIAVLAALVVGCAACAEVNFTVIPTGTCPFPNAPWCSLITQGGALVWVFPSADLAENAKSYTVTVTYSIAHPGVLTTGTMTKTVGPSYWGNQPTEIPVAQLGWSVADVPDVTITAVSITADTGQIQVTKSVKDPMAAVKY
jgi:hypothetical protein